MIYKSLSQSIQTTKQIKKEDACKFILQLNGNILNLSHDLLSLLPQRLFTLWPKQSPAGLNSLILTFSILIECHHLSPSYLLGGSLAVVMVLTSSTAELKSLMFSEEYSPDGLLYWLVTTLEPKPVKGRALLLWVEPMCFTSCKNQAAKVRRLQYLWNSSVIETSNTLCTPEEL